MATKRSAKERRRSRRRAAAVLVPTIAGVFVAGTAFAYWTTTGNGTGTATTGTDTPVTITQTGITPSDLSPDGPARPIEFTIANAKSSPQRVAGVTIAIDSITYTSGGADAIAAGCQKAWFTINQPSALNTDIPASGSTAFTSTGATIRLVDSSTNQNTCKGVTLGLTYTAL